MAYFNPIFQAIPAIYAVPPRHQQIRRTATNTLAGRFDPLPVYPDFDRPDPSTSRSTPLSMELDPPLVVGSPLLEPRRVVGKKGGRSAMLKNPRRGLMVTGLSDGQVSKGRATRRAPPEEKENEIAAVDREPSESLSPPPPPPSPPTPPPTGNVDDVSDETVGSIPRTSGFWKARATRQRDGGDSTKRKRSSMPDEKDTSSPAENPRSKKPRLSETVVSDERSRVFYSTSPSLVSPGSLSSSMSEPLEISDPIAESYTDKADASHFYEDGAGLLQCKACPNKYFTIPSLEAHFEANHKDQMVQDAEKRERSPPQLLPTRRRGVRKNVALKKGWKGWVEDDLEPQKLILLDKPEVLPERTTRSGRKID
ncbi:hypothetical protein JB92DRAFT_3045533 [Gautieria morchelliformis]|nr:hypothetical protein JB92DRAFT_3045533 [Gautieria morchelliformis]